MSINNIEGNNEGMLFKSQTPLVRDMIERTISFLNMDIPSDPDLLLYDIQEIWDNKGINLKIRLKSNESEEINYKIEDLKTKWEKRSTLKGFIDFSFQTLNMNKLRDENNNETTNSKEDPRNMIFNKQTNEVKNEIIKIIDEYGLKEKFSHLKPEEDIDILLPEVLEISDKIKSGLEISGLSSSNRNQGKNNSFYQDYYEQDENEEGYYDDNDYYREFLDNHWRSYLEKLEK